MTSGRSEPAVLCFADGRLLAEYVLEHAAYATEHLPENSRLVEVGIETTWRKPDAARHRIAQHTDLDV